jgi:putative SOS response-associated peptidase YedK
MINARAETVAERPGFRDAFARGRRCLVPADGFYEWRASAAPKVPKQPDRMPVILLRDSWAAWLGEEPAEPEDLLGLLIPYPSAELAAWPVPRRVGRVAEDDPGLAERDPAAPAVAGLDDPPP